MKSIFVVLFIALPTIAFAGIMPESVTEGMSSADAIVTCIFKDKNVDFSEVNISESGDMVMTTNPKFASDEMAPFILYKGMDVEVSAETITVQGQILTLGGEVDMNLQVVRGKKNKVEVLDETLTCTTK